MLFAVEGIVGDRGGRHLHQAWQPQAQAWGWFLRETIPNSYGFEAATHPSARVGTGVICVGGGQARWPAPTGN